MCRWLWWGKQVSGVVSDVVGAVDTVDRKVGAPVTARAGLALVVGSQVGFDTES